MGLGIWKRLTWDWEYSLVVFVEGRRTEFSAHHPGSFGFALYTGRHSYEALAFSCIILHSLVRLSIVKDP
jgi:hypothetical protein